MKKLLFCFLILVASLGVTAQDFTWILYEADDPESEYFAMVEDDALTSQAMDVILNADKKQLEDMMERYKAYCSELVADTVLTIGEYSKGELVWTPSRCPEYKYYRGWDIGTVCLDTVYEGVYANLPERYPLSFPQVCMVPRECPSTDGFILWVKERL